MSDGIVFPLSVFLSALWIGRPHLTISIATISSSSRHRAGKRTVYFRCALWAQAHVGIIYPLSLQCPICQLTDKAQMFLTCQFWCQQLCFICSQIPCRVKWCSIQKDQMARWTFLRSSQTVNTPYLKISWLQKQICRRETPEASLLRMIKNDLRAFCQ